MTAENSLNEKFHDLLKQLTSWATGFFELLEQEKEALSDKDIDTLELVTKQKLEALNQLDGLLEFTNDQTGLDTLDELMSWAKTNAMNSPETGRLLELLNKMQNLNNINGQLINRRTLQNKFLTNLLLGQSTDGETYKLNGQTDQGDSSCRIGTA